MMSPIEKLVKTGCTLNLTDVNLKQTKCMLCKLAGPNLFFKFFVLISVLSMSHIGPLRIFWLPRPPAPESEQRHVLNIVGRVAEAVPQAARSEGRSLACIHFKLTSVSDPSLTSNLKPEPSACSRSRTA